VQYPVSWADEERDLTAWLGNDFQDEAFDKLYQLESKIKNCSDPEIQHDWMLLQASDHFYYMCTKWFSDGDVHKYFNPYGSPYEAFINYMNVLSDFIIRVDKTCASTEKEMNDIKEMAGKLMDEVEEMAKKKIGATKKKVKKTIDDSKDLKLEDVKNMSNAAIKKLLKEVDIKELTIALKDAGEEVREKILPNLGKKARKTYDELQQDLKSFKKKDIKKYRKTLEDKLKELFGK
jgi:alpha-amylase/alpha-mannosidase (GH57 family)